jgi:hypothetical protein
VGYLDWNCCCCCEILLDRHKTLSFFFARLGYLIVMSICIGFVYHFLLWRWDGISGALDS